MVKSEVNCLCEVIFLSIWPNLHSAFFHLGCIYLIYIYVLKYLSIWRACKQHKFVSNSRGGWEAQNQGTGRLGGTCYLVNRRNLLFLFSNGVKKNSFCSLILTIPLLPFLRVLPSWPNHFPKTSPLNAITWRWHGAGRMSQWLRALDDLPEDLSSILNIHMATHHGL